jgi:hypothetical protein
MGKKIAVNYSAEEVTTAVATAAAEATPGAASVQVAGERVPLTVEGLRRAKCDPAELGRALRRRFDLDD